MSAHHDIELEIRRILATETHAVTLSNKLFRPGGLFSQLAAGAGQRRRVARSALFQQALDRLSDLERKDAAEFAAVVDEARKKLGGDDVVRFHVESVNSA